MDDTRAVLSFYQGTGRDQSGRTLDDVLAFDYGRREAEHDYIQWLFPIPETSGANPWAPVLTDEAAAEFRARPELREKLRRAFLFMLDFFGLQLREAGAGTLIVEEGPDFARRAPVWLYPRSHNFLRISRILRCLRLLGLPAEAAAFLACLEDLHRRYPDQVPSPTMGYWRARGGK